MIARIPRRSGILFILPLVLGGLVVGGASPVGAIATDVGLGTADTYAVLAGETVTNTGPSVISGDVGVSPGTAVDGFPPGIVNNGSIFTAAAAASPKADLTTAYLNAAGQAFDATISADLGGQTLVGGVYTGGALEITGTLTLDAENNPDKVWVFQAASSLVTASSSQVKLIRGADPCNVFWQVTSSATLGTNSTFVGTVMALTSIFATTGATVTGRLLARNGEVTLDTNTINRPICLDAAKGSVSVTKTVKPSSLPDWSVDFTISPDPVDGLHGATQTSTKSSPIVSWINLDPNTTYTITEGVLPSGWTAGTLDCVELEGPPAGPSRRPHGVPTPAPSDSFSGANDVECAVENVAPPRVLIQKTTLGGFGGPFTFQVDNGDLQTLVVYGPPVTITTDTAGVPQPAIPVTVEAAPGLVRVQEIGVATGFQAVSLMCTGYNADGQSIGSGTELTLPQGGEMRCQAVNEKLASVSVTKSVDGPGPWSFQFTISPDPDGVGGQSAMLSATNLVPVVSWTGLDPGTQYTVTEAGVAGFISGSVVCTGVAGNVFTPVAGEVVSCGVENRVVGSIELTKSVSGAVPGDVWSFEFTLTPGGVVRTVSNASPVVSWTGLDPDVDYTVTESVSTDPSYVTGSIVCGLVSGVAVAGVTVDVVPGATVSCTAVNLRGEMPNTGANPFGLVGVGIALLGVGAAFHFIGRRRRLVTR